MILVKVPLRLSFFGGGSDIPAYFTHHEGATLSATFNKYAYVSIMSTPQPHIKVAYSTTEYADSIRNVKHDIVREALYLYNISSHIEISSFADIPTVGTGLGASSAFNVALVIGLDRFTNRASRYRDRRNLLHVIDTAVHIELTQVGAPIGYQDHIAAAMGGFLFVEYSAKFPLNRPFKIKHINTSTRYDLFDRLFLVKVPTRYVSANTILAQGLRPQVVDNLVSMAYDAKEYLEQGNFTEFGRLMHESWEEKKRANDLITTPEIDALYQKARASGILGGKLLGAGNGGYFLLCAENPEAKQHMQTHVFNQDEWYNVRPAVRGAEIVYEDNNGY